MKKIITTILFVLMVLILKSQVPEKFNFQGVLRNASDELIKNTNIGIRISLIEGSASGAEIYVETHTVQTNNYGQFAIQVGAGNEVSGDFSSIDWASGQIYIKTSIDENGGSNYSELNTIQLITVPYSLFSNNTNTSKYSIIADTANIAKRLAEDVLYFTDTDTLFAVKDREGNVVFAVFPDGAEVYVNQTTKGKVGGFAVSGRSPSKANGIDILRVTIDSTRIYVSDTIGVKGKVGGFAISGRSPSKGVSNEYLVVTGDSTRIYVNDTSTTKGKVGGFAVSGRSPSKGATNDYLTITRDSTRIYITESGTKGKVGGFAVSGRSPSKGTESDYFNISGNSAADVIDPSEARILWYPKKEAFLTGKVYVESPDSVGFNSMSTGYKSRAIGNYSQAMGYSSTARGQFSTAIGNEALASDSNSFAFGNYAQATGLNSFAFGDSAIATAQDAYAFGAYSYASGLGSFSIGSKDRNQHDATYSTAATGQFAFAVGFDAEALGEESVAVGHGVTASGFNSVAIGRGASASADYATALSYGNASGLQSFAMSGGQTTGDFAFALGWNSLASGNSSVAIGSSSHATAERSIAMGGYNAYATGTYATSIGYYTTAQSYRSFVIGYYNVIAGSSGSEVATDPLFVIGNGVSWQRRNALVVYKNGDMELDGNLYPEIDNTYDLGTSSLRWDDVYATSGVVNSSDKRLKTNIRDLNYGLKEVLQLRPVSFNWIDKPEKGIKLGLIAQEVQPVIKEVVNVGDDENKTLGINYSDLIPVLIKGIQEQQTQIESITSENTQLKSQLQEMNDLYKTVIERLDKLGK